MAPEIERERSRLAALRPSSSVELYAVERKWSALAVRVLTPLAQGLLEDVAAGELALAEVGPMLEEAARTAWASNDEDACDMAGAALAAAQKEVA